MNIAHLRAFHAVARAGSFTVAARALHVTQPTLSAQVKTLEEYHRVQLLERGARGVRLTPLGENLYALSTRLFAIEAEAEEMLGGARELQHGRLRVGADGPHHVIPLLAAFTRRYPGLDVSLDMGNADGVLRDLRAHRIDVALVARVDDDARLHAVAYRRSPLVLFVPRDHRLARRGAVRLAELAGERLVLREAASVTRQVFQRALDESGVQPASVMRIESREAVREAVAAGLGVGVVAEAELDRDPRIKALAIRDHALGIVEHLVCLAEHRERPIVAAFMEVAAASADEASPGA